MKSTVLGAAVTGLLLMPWLGMPRTLALGIAVNALVAIVVLVRNNPHWRRTVLGLSPLLAALFVWWTGVQFSDTWQRLFTLGMWRGATPPGNLAEYRAMSKQAV